MLNRTSLKAGDRELMNTREAFFQCFGSYVSTALGFHELLRARGYNPKYVSEGPFKPSYFSESKEMFITSVQDIMRARLPVSKGVTYQRLQEIIDIAMGDWWNEDVVKQVFKKGEYLRSLENTSLQVITGNGQISGSYPEG